MKLSECKVGAVVYLSEHLYPETSLHVGHVVRLSVALDLSGEEEVVVSVLWAFATHPEQVHPDTLEIYQG